MASRSEHLESMLKRVTILTEGQAAMVIVPILDQVRSFEGIISSALKDPETAPTREELLSRKEIVRQVLDRAYDNWCHKHGIDE